MAWRVNILRLVFLLLLSFAPVLAGARDSRYTRHGTGPKYWIAYEYCYDLNKPMTELRWKNNIDWMAETFRDYGYDMICNDGWIEAAQTVDANGYITKYNSGWVHDFSYWNDYIESKGMKAGIYYNPLWLTRTAYAENCPVKGAGGITARQITGYHAFNGELYWVDVDKPGAEQWVKGYVRHFIDLGAKYLRIDFLENYEKNYGTERYEKALKWIAEEAGDEIFLSLVMPNCWNHGQTELKYGDMIRISDDCFEGDWDFVSGRRRGQHKDDWPQYGNVFDGCIAYRNSDEWHEAMNRTLYRSRRHLAEEIMRTLGCTFDPAQVGMFLWGRIPDSYTDVEELTEKVLHEARVFITPGFIFGSNGARYIRISLCAKEEKLAEALQRIKNII